MIELMALGFLVAAACLGVGLALAVLKILLWTVLLPLRVILGILFLPLLLLKAVVGGLALVILGPILAVLLLAGLLAATAAVLVPLLPLLLLGSLVWLIVRATERPALAR